MKTNVVRIRPRETGERSISVGSVGRVVGRTSEGDLLVDFPGHLTGPRVARCLAGVHVPETFLSEDRAEVLILLENGDEERPIIVGFIEPRGSHVPPSLLGTWRRDTKENVRVDGRVLELNGRERVVLTCGKSSITLHADGRVIVKGTRLVSRASESNRIKGATIALN